jgi:hypothetical protein
MTDEADTRLRALYGAVAADQPAGGHPSPEELAAVVEGRVGDAVRLRVLDHVMTCGSCRRDYDLLRATQTAAGGRAQRRWRPSMATLAVAAALVVALIMRRAAPTAEPTDVVRGPVAADTGVVQLVRPRGRVAAGPLVWHAVHGAVQYRVEVDDDSGAVVLHTTVRDTTILAPALEAGRAYQWWVVAVGADGAGLSSSVAPFTIAR